jgi:hypothetical protein
MQPTTQKRSRAPRALVMQPQVAFVLLLSYFDLVTLDRLSIHKMLSPEEIRAIRDYIEILSALKKFVNELMYFHDDEFFMLEFCCQCISSFPIKIVVDFILYIPFSFSIPFPNFGTYVLTTL